MIKLALKTYRKNIWDIFAVTGIVAIGVLIGVLVAAPGIYNLLFYNTSKILSSATSLAKSGFDVNAFIDSITKQIGGLNWNNPVASIQGLLDNKGYIQLFTNALIDSGFQKDVVAQLTGTIAECADAIVVGVRQELVFMMTCTAVTCLIAFVTSRFIIQWRTVQIKSMRDKSVKRFALTFVLNLTTVLFVYSVIIVSLLYDPYILGIIFSIFGAILVLFVLTLLWAAICYRNKRMKLTTIFNFKTLAKYALCCLIVLGISLAVFAIAFVISDVMGLLLIMPLIFTTNIIMENIVVAYTMHYQTVKRAENKRRKLKEQKKKAKAKAAA